MDKKISNWLHAWDCPQGFVLFKRKASFYSLLNIIAGSYGFKLQSALSIPLLEKGHTDTKILKFL